MRKVPLRIVVPGHPVNFVRTRGLPYTSLTIEQAVAHAHSLAVTHNTRTQVKLDRKAHT